MWYINLYKRKEVLGGVVGQRQEVFRGYRSVFLSLQRFRVEGVFKIQQGDVGILRMQIVMGIVFFILWIVRVIVFKQDLRKQRLVNYVFVWESRGILRVNKICFLFLEFSLVYQFY